MNLEHLTPKEGLILNAEKIKNDLATQWQTNVVFIRNKTVRKQSARLYASHAYSDSSSPLFDIRACKRITAWL